jgi:hypothetical protein
MLLGDALVAGTALVHGLTLVTRNTEDFDWIPGLPLFDPFKPDLFRLPDTRAGSEPRRGPWDPVRQ